MTINNRALVLFSGGQDSVTCLAWALDNFNAVYTIGFNYGQRHVVELTQRRVILDQIEAIKPEWSGKLRPPSVVVDVTPPAPSALTDHARSVNETEGGLPVTFLPGRNLLFLTYAGALARTTKIDNIVAGMCETDYSGYPDCRRATIDAMEKAINLGMGSNMVIHTPLMYIDKQATWGLAHQLGGQKLVDLIIEDSHTCYNGDRRHRHEWGYGCGTCPACILREKGYDSWVASGKSSL